MFWSLRELCRPYLLGHGICSFVAIVALRITPIKAEEGTLMRVDGRLEAESVSELERACTGMRFPLTLDLEGVLWIDDRAAESLRQLIASGAVVANASPYVSLRLKGEDDETRIPGAQEEKCRQEKQSND